MAKRKEQYRKQQIATVGHSDKFSRRMKRLADKIVWVERCMLREASATGRLSLQVGKHVI